MPPILFLLVSVHLSVRTINTRDIKKGGKVALSLRDSRNAMQSNFSNFELYVFFLIYMSIIQDFSLVVKPV